MSNYKLGIIGYGGMGRWHHTNLDKVSGITPVAAYDISEEALKLAKSNGLKVYESFKDIISDKDIDIITIATPNEFHCPYAIDAMKAGKHVISEKPVALSSDELQKMIDASIEFKKVFSIHQNRRWDKDYRIIKEIYDKGLIGNIFSVQSRVMGSRGIPGDWRAHKEHGGGMVLDWGVHMIDQALDMIKEKVTDVYVRMQHVKHTEVDDGFQLFLTFESGIVYLIEVSTCAYINLPRWHVSGIGGTAVIDDWSCTGKIIKPITGKENEDAKPIKAGAGLTKTMAPRTEETTVEEPLPQVEAEWTEYYQNIKACLDGEKELIVKPQQAMRVMKVMEAAFASEKENCSIKTSI